MRHFVLPGWSSKLSLILWVEEKSVRCCSWTRASVRAFDIICVGHCTGCKAKIQCVATPNFLQFNIENFKSNFAHDPKKKRRVLNVDTPKMHEKLDGKSVLKLRAEMAAELMSFGDAEPLIIPTADAMRKAKSRINCPETDPFTALSFLQKKFPKAIHSIRYDPFYIIFSTPYQQAVYKREAMRNNRITISIDSTGLGNLSK